jgi:hypothetical protein
MKITTCTRCGKEYPWTHQSAMDPQEYLTRWCDPCAREIWQRRSSVIARKFYREIARSSPLWRRIPLFPKQILIQHHQYGKSWGDSIRYAATLFRSRRFLKSEVSANMDTLPGFIGRDRQLQCSVEGCRNAPQYAGFAHGKHWGVCVYHYESHKHLVDENCRSGKEIWR